MDRHQRYQSEASLILRNHTSKASGDSLWNMLLLGNDLREKKSKQRSPADDLYIIIYVIDTVEETNVSRKDLIIHKLNQASQTTNLSFQFFIQIIVLQNLTCSRPSMAFYCPNGVNSENWSSQESACCNVSH